MARNPYASFNASADPYTNGDGLGAPSSQPPSRSPAATPSTDEYDPYGDRYGAPPINTSSSRERRPGPRAGGYGGFNPNSNGSGPGVQAPPQQLQQQDGRDPYSNRSRENSGARSQRRPSEESRRFRNEVDGNMPPPEMPATRNFTRPNTGERTYSGNNGMNNNSSRDRTQGTSRNGGDGTRQIEG
jgi:hypothetical protein